MGDARESYGSHSEQHHHTSMSDLDGGGGLGVAVEIVSPGSSDKKALLTESKGVAAFVQKLYNMIEEEKHNDIIHWTPNGSFLVTSPDLFAKEVLPQYFKHNNFASFVRQLNMYGFHKINDFVNTNPGSDVQSWEFSHPSFRKGKREMLSDIKRKTSSKNQNSPRVFGLPYGGIGTTSDAIDNMSLLEKTFKDQKDTVSILSLRVMTLEDKLKLTNDAHQALYGDVVQLRHQVNMLQQILHSVVQHAQGEDDGVQTGQKRKRLHLDAGLISALASIPQSSGATASLLAAAAAANDDGLEQ
eukprot:Unigene4053_Nuclearia_a/m.12315 Unigene4053_Nuclearia_a/g.12315  ORF Unigene4053_Nuclearia_a/g.12315 Unigene4053_Nuclearia_a/m.12315 type:complete len:300 (+) Unigene4053_Nuclearia_a:3-902(+)